LCRKNISDCQYDLDTGSDCASRYPIDMLSYWMERRKRTDVLMLRACNLFKLHNENEPESKIVEFQKKNMKRLRYKLRPIQLHPFRPICRAMSPPRFQPHELVLISVHANKTVEASLILKLVFSYFMHSR